MKQFTMTKEQHEKLLDAGKPTPVMYLSGGRPMGGTPQENANAAWASLGRELGFDHMTVRPVPNMPTTVFEAEETDEEEDPTPWCHVCHAMEQKDCDCLPIAENN